MANRITTVFDVVDKGFSSALKNMRTAVAQADGAFGKFKAGGKAAFDSIKGSAALAGTAVVGSLGVMAAKAISAASDLGESVNAVEVTFGPVADGIKRLGEEAAESVGLSNAEFNGLAVQFSSFAQTVAGSKGDVVGTIDEMTTRVADFASVMNLDVPEAARIFQSALAGETEPIKKFGIDLSAARVEQFALAEGLIKTKGELTENIKVQARYGLLMKSTAKTAGDFALTSDSLANQQRILAAKTTDTAAAYGQALKPAMEAIVPLLNDTLDAAKDLAPAFQRGAEQIGDVVESAEPLIDALGLIADGAGLAAGGFREADEATDGWLSKIGGKVMKDALRKGVFGPITGGILEAKDAFDAITGSTDEAAISLDHLDERSYRFGGTVEEVAISLDHLDDRTGAAKREFQLLELAEENVARASEKASEAFQENTRELEDQIAATNELFSAKAALVGGDIAVRDAQRQAAEAVAELNVLTDEGKAGTDEFAAAQDNAAQALIDAAGAARDQAVAQAESNGSTVSAQTANQILIDKLSDLASTLAPGSELRAQIEGYIGDLKAIPAEINTTFVIKARGATVTPHGDIIGGSIGVGNVKGATGGIVTRPTLALIGEAGPEAVVPLNQTPGSSPLPGMGGGMTVNLTVNAGLGANGKEIGDQVVNALRQYERRNGTAWRS